MNTKWTLAAVSVILLVAGMACVPLSHYITPAQKDGRAVQYSSKAGIADPNDYAGYFNLDKAVRLENAVTNAHEKTQLELIQEIDKDSLQYAQLAKTTKQNRMIAQQREEQLFGPEGLLTLGLSVAGASGLAGLIGLMRKRPGDVTPEEVRDLLGGAELEIGEKERQFSELVKGIQKFIELGKGGIATDPAIVADIECLKSELAKVQSADTKEEVARIKATI